MSDADDVRARMRENATEIASTIVTGIWLAALFTGQSWWLPALIVGYAMVVPLVALLFGEDADREEWWDDWTGDWGDWTGSKSTDEATEATDGTANAPTDALETIRDRYARGELTDEQFERKLDRLLETETIENADEWRRSAREHREREREFES